MALNKNVYRLKVDIKSTRMNIVPSFVQYDDARLEFEVFDGGMPYDLTGFTSVQFAHRRPDKVVVVGSGELVVDEYGMNIVRYDYRGSEMHELGTVETSFSLIDAEADKVSVHPFRVSIVDDLQDAVVDPANPEFGLLQELIAQVNKASEGITQAILDVGVATEEAVAVTTGAREATNAANAAATGLTAIKDAAVLATGKATEATTKANTAAGKAEASSAGADTAMAAVRAATANADIVIASAGQAAEEAFDAAEAADAVMLDYKHVGPYNAATQYKRGNEVSINGSSYVAKVNTIGNAPVIDNVVNNTYWTLRAQRGTDGKGAVSTINGTPPDAAGNVQLTELQEINRLTTAVSNGANVVTSSADSLVDVEIEGNTLTSLGNSNLEATKKYVVADKKTKVIVTDATNYEGTTVSGVGKFVKGSDKVTTANFVGKVAGSTVVNPHISKRIGIQSTLQTPTGTWSESSDGTSTGGYSVINSLNGATGFVVSSGSGSIPQQLFSFDIIAEIERKLGLIPRTTLADKVAWIKDNVETMKVNWHGFGSSVGGNKATLKIWTAGSWAGSSTHPNSTVTLLTRIDNIGAIETDGFVHFLAHAEPSDGVVASTINTDYVELVVTLKPTAQLNTRPKVIRVENFEGKVSGSTVENPHVTKGSNTSTTLNAPSVGWGSESQDKYESIKSMNNIYMSTYAVINGQIAQQLFSFNLIEAVERNIGRIPRTSVADKVAWLKTNLSRFMANWHGFGTSVGGNKATFVCASSSGAWVGAGTSHSASTVTRLQSLIPQGALSTYIQSDGFVHFLAYAEPSDGTTPSVINTDYIDLEIEMKVDADFTQPKVALYEVDDASYAKILVDWNADEVVSRYPIVEGTQHLQGVSVGAEGENLLPPFTEWTLHANARVVNPYELELKPTTTYQSSSYKVKVVPNTAYTLSVPFIDGGTLFYEQYDINNVRLSTVGIGIVGNRTFTILPTCNYLLIAFSSDTFATGTFTLKNPTLTLGSVAKPFVPRNPSYLFADVKLGAIGTTKDVLYEQDGRWLLRKSVEKDVVLDGSLEYTVYYKDNGFKQVRITILQGLALAQALLVKNNGVIVPSNTSASIDNYQRVANGMVLNVADNETGWVQSFTPSISDVKRYFNGWKYTSGTTWTSVTGNGQTATAQVALDTKPTDYTPYKLSYVLATPVVTDVTDKVEGALKVNGATQVNVDSGVVVREKVVPEITSSTAYVNRTSLPKTLLRNKVKSIVGIFKNGIVDKSWTTSVNNIYENNAGAFSSLTDFDPSATYTITYLALDKPKLTTNATNVKLTYAANLASVVSDLVTNVEDVQRDASIHKFVHDYIEGKADNNRADLLAHVGNTGQHVTTAEKILIAGATQAGHKHVIDDVTGLAAALATKSTFSGKYTDLLEKPTTFPPATHGHAIGDVTGLSTALANAGVAYAHSFGLGTFAKQLPAGSDLNNVTAELAGSGMFMGTELINGPVSDGWAFIHNMRHNAQYGRQIAYLFGGAPGNAGKTLQRHQEAGTWSPWVAVNATSTPWASVALQNGWSGTIHYRRNAINQLDVIVQVTTGTTTGGTVIANLPDGFRVAAGRGSRIEILFANNLGMPNGTLSYDSAGNIKVAENSMFATGNTLVGTAVIPL